MAQLAVERAAGSTDRDGQPQLSGDMRRLIGSTLRQVYERTLDTQPIPVSQVDLLLQLRHKERDRRRVG